MNMIIAKMMVHLMAEKSEENLNDINLFMSSGLYIGGHLQRPCRTGGDILD